MMDNQLLDPISRLRSLEELQRYRSQDRPRLEKAATQAAKLLADHDAAMPVLEGEIADLRIRLGDHPVYAEQLRRHDEDSAARRQAEEKG